MWLTQRTVLSLALGLVGMTLYNLIMSEIIDSVSFYFATIMLMAIAAHLINELTGWHPLLSSKFMAERYRKEATREIEKLAAEERAAPVRRQHPKL